jgi:predicted nucleic acid-binding protein
MKVIIFDASSIISLVMSCLIHELIELKKIFKGKFIIPHEVKEEIVDRPMGIKRFELEALRIKDLIDNGVLELPSCIDVDSKKISNKTNEVLKTANSIFSSKNKPVKMIHSGEASCIALGMILKEKGVSHALCIDERTTRMLVEKPQNLRELLEKKMNSKIILQQKAFDYFKDFKILRSSELMYIAYKKNIVRLKGEKVLDALLYSLKFKGCSISD